MAFALAANAADVCGLGRDPTAIKGFCREIWEDKTRGMRRFYLRDIEFKNSTAALDGDEHHHARNVLRLGAGDEVSIFDGRGREYLCRIEKVGKKETSLS